MMEIAEILKVNPMTVRNWISRKELPALRVGSRRVRVRRTDFDAFLARSHFTGLPVRRETPPASDRPLWCTGDRGAGAAAEGGAVHESQARAGMARATGARVDTERRRGLGGGLPSFR